MIDLGLLFGIIAIILCILFCIILISLYIAKQKEENYVDSPEKLEEKRDELRQIIGLYKIDKQYTFGDYILGI